MSITKSRALRSSVLGITALATNAVWGKGGTNIEDGLGVGFLTLEEIPGQNVAVCLQQSNTGKSSNNSNNYNDDKGGVLPDALSIVVDPFEGNTIKMLFTISEMIASDENRVLVLIYSTKSSPTPQMRSHLSSPPLGLDLEEMQIMGFYNIPAIQLEPQESTELGIANPRPTSVVTVNFNFDTSKLVEKINAGNNTIYVQAAMIKASDFENNDFDNMILSEMDTLQFVKECPTNVRVYKADNNGYVTSSGSKTSTGERPPSSNISQGK